MHNHQNFVNFCQSVSNDFVTHFTRENAGPSYVWFLHCCKSMSCDAFSFKLCTHTLHETDSLSVWWEAFQLSNSLHTSYINMRSSYTIYVLCCCLDGIGHRFYSIFSPHKEADHWCGEGRSLMHWVDMECQTSRDYITIFFSFFMLYMYQHDMPEYKYKWMCSASWFVLNWCHGAEGQAYWSEKHKKN